LPDDPDKTPPGAPDREAPAVGATEPFGPRYDHGTEKAKSLEAWAAPAPVPSIGATPPFSILLPPIRWSDPLEGGRLADALIGDIFARYRTMRGDSASLQVVLSPGRVPAGRKASPGDGSPPPSADAPAPPPAQAPGAPATGEELRAALADLWSSHGILTRDCRWVLSTDEAVRNAVSEAFTVLLQKGLLYSSQVLLKWCPTCGTALSGPDLKGIEEAGNVWTVRCAVSGLEDRAVMVATPAPETLPAIAAVVVPAGDEAQKDLHKSRVAKPAGRGDVPVIPTPIVSSRGPSEVRALVPGRKTEDFQLAAALGVQAEPLFRPDGTLSEAAGPYGGLAVSAAREKALQDLKASGAIEKVERSIVEREECARCGHAAVPLVSFQWNLRMSALAERAAQAVQEGKVSIHPREGQKEFLRWSQGLSDQRVSRWDIAGAEVPRRRCSFCGELVLPAEAAAPCAKCGRSDWRSEGALEPWFVDAVATLAGLGCLPESPEPAPSAWVCSDRASFYSWAARVLFLGLEISGKIPFRSAFLHGKARLSSAPPPATAAGPGSAPAEDSGGGPDAFRLTLVGKLKAFRDLGPGPRAGEGERQFLHKAWNAVRFAARATRAPSKVEGEALATEDRWILARLEAASAAVSRFLDGLDPGRAATAVADFLRDDFSRWYVETARPRLRRGLQAQACRQTLLLTAGTALRLLHPFAPFHTEALRRRLEEAAPSDPRGELPLHRCPWPGATPSPEAAALDRKMDVAKAIVRGVHNIRSHARVPRKVPLHVMISFFDRAQLDLASEFRELLGHLVNAGSLDLGVQLAKPTRGAVDVSGDFQIFVPLEIREHQEKEVERLRRRLQAFEDPGEVSAGARHRKEALSGHIRVLREHLDHLTRDLAGAGPVSAGREPGLMV
jgi:valyl-tRNA synthetase